MHISTAHIRNKKGFKSSLLLTQLQRVHGQHTQHICSCLYAVRRVAAAQTDNARAHLYTYLYVYVCTLVFSVRLFVVVASAISIVSCFSAYALLATAFVLLLLHLEALEKLCPLFFSATPRSNFLLALYAPCPFAMPYFVLNTIVIVVVQQLLPHAFATATRDKCWHDFIPNAFMDSCGTVYYACVRALAPLH